MGKLKKTACIAAMLVTMTALLLNTSSEEAVRTINMPEAAEAAPIELLPQIPQAIERIYLRAENLPKETDGELNSLREMLLAKTGSFNGEWSVYVKNLDSGRSVSINNGRVYAASLIKLYVAGAVYENADDVRAAESYSGETDELLSDMISQSSNDACNTLVTRLGGGDADKGMAAVNSFCEAHGYADTEMNRLMLDFNGKENYTSPADCCAIMSDYYSGKLAGAESVINYMRAQATRTKIPAGIPEEAEVANKTGELSSVENDSAIVFAPQGTFFLCIMTNGDADTAAARTDITQAAGLVYTEMTN